MRSEPIWLSVANMMKGVAEIPGPQSNPIIVRWAKEIGAPAYTNDDIAWCAVFMNRDLMACQLPRAGTGYDLLRALVFAVYGQSLTRPSLGCIQVFKRAEGGHVGLYLGERADAYYVYGGNTSNQVGATWIAKERLVTNRWPPGVPLPVTGPVTLTNDSAFVSMDEA